MWKNILAALTALGLVFGSNAAMAGDFELGIDGSKDEIKVEAKLNEERAWKLFSLIDRLLFATSPRGGKGNKVVKRGKALGFQRR